MLKASRLKLFLFGIPLLILFGSGILVSTAKKVSPAVACSPKDYLGIYEPNEKLGFYEGKEVSVPADLAQNKGNLVLGQSDPSERWIEVSLSEQRLRAWDGGSLFLETPVSSGLPWWPTPKGEFRIWTKLRYTRMQGGSGAYYYNLPNVPYVMFFQNDKIPGFSAS